MDDSVATTIATHRAAVRNLEFRFEKAAERFAKFVERVGGLVKIPRIFRCNPATVGQILFIAYFRKFGGKGVAFKDHGCLAVALFAARVKVARPDQGLAPLEDGVFGVVAAFGLPVFIIALTIPFPDLHAAAALTGLFALVYRQELFVIAAATSSRGLPSQVSAGPKTGAVPFSARWCSSGGNEGLAAWRPDADGDPLYSPQTANAATTAKTMIKT
jgi:hypothetical protein